MTAEPTSDPPSNRQDALAASLSCYYAQGAHPARPQCEGLAVVAYANIALCSACDKMRSAVGRTNAARPLPAAQLYQLMAAARALAQAEYAVAAAVRHAHQAERLGPTSATPSASAAKPLNSGGQPSPAP